MQYRTNPERIELHRQWWERTNRERLALIYTPLPHPYGGLDVDVPVSEIASRKRANALVEYQVPKDVLVTGYVDFATALIPGLLGAGFRCDQHTSWAIPAVQSIRDVSIPPFNPDHPLFQSFIERVKAVAAGWSWETYLPATHAYLGPLDVLAGVLGPERLAFDLYEEPELVRARAMDAAAFLEAMARYELDILRQAGVLGGTPCAFNYWLPGDGFLFSEDFCALVSRRHYEQFFLEADTAFCQTVDSAFLHLHSAGFQCLPAILQNPYLRGLELANDINNTDLQKLIDAGRLVQEHNLPLQVSSWEHPLEEAEIERLLSALDPRGLIVALQARSLEEAERLYDKIKTWPS